MITTRKKIKKQKQTKHASKTYINKLKKNGVYYKTIEFILLTSTLINHILLLKSMKKSSLDIKNEIIDVLKEIREKGNNNIVLKSTSDNEIKKIVVILIKYINTFLKNEKKISHNGGFYFKDIEDKGDKPITGKDVSRLLDEIQDLFYNLQYVDEGKFLREVYVLLNLLRGETGDLKQYLTWSIFPQYYQITPPFIKWDAWKKAWNSRKYEDLPDYLLAYQKYNKARDEYLVAKGLKSPTVLQKDLYVGKFDKIANALDRNILTFQRYRMKLQFKTPVTVF